MVVDELTKIEKVSEKRLGMIIRHAERYDIKDSEPGDGVLLTEKGMRDSVDLGKLKRFAPVLMCETKRNTNCLLKAGSVKLQTM